MMGWSIGLDLARWKVSACEGGCPYGSDGPTFCAHKKCRTVADVMTGGTVVSTSATVLHFLSVRKNVGPSPLSTVRDPLIVTAATVLHF